jgi:hypothetical protein
MARLYDLDYSLSMKYIVILAVVILLVRIDLILALIDRTVGKFSSKNVESGVSVPASEMIPFEDKKVLKTPKKVFLTLLENFHANPNTDFRNRIIAELKTHPQLFSDNLDRDLEGAIYQLRDLLGQKNLETSQLIIELIPLLKGENQDFLKKFFSYLMEIDLGMFLEFYIKYPDPDCSVVILLEDRIPEEEKLNELRDRLGMFEAFLAKENSPILLTNYATNCQLVLKNHLDRLLAPPTPSVEEPTL